jgi:hypothetical protein
MAKSYQRELFEKGLKAGLKKGWGGFVWMMQIIIPISFLTSMLQWSGWLAKIDFILQPVMGVMSLPSLAAFPLLIGMLANLYGAIAVMVMLPFTVPQMTLMAIFLLMAHNLIQEGIIQGKSGINPIKATLFRIFTAMLTVMIVAPMIQGSADPVTSAQAIPVTSIPFSQAIQEWLVTTFSLSVKIFFIIMALLTFLEVLKSLGWINYIVRFFAPLLMIMGLDRKTGFLWMTAIVFGLAYGGAIIVEEAQVGHLSKEELEMLQLSIGINHSMVEDPMLFVAIGLCAFWLYIPRLIMAIVSVRLIRFWYRFKEGRAP